MAQPRKETILEFQKIIKEEYGKEMSFEEASETVRNLVGYFDLLAKIFHRDKRAIDNRFNSQC